MKKSRVALALILLLIVGILSVVLADVKSSAVIISANVALSSSTKKAAFTMQTKADCDVLSVSSYTLYKSNGTVVTSGSISSTASGMRYSKSVDFSSYITSGSSYYVTAVFSADGETKNATSATISY